MNLFSGKTVLKTPRGKILKVPLSDFSAGDMIFSSKGNGFKVQSSTNLIEGFWFNVSEVDTPPVTIVQINGAAFFRID